MNEYHSLHILIEERKFLSGLERAFPSGLERKFSSGQDRKLEALRFQIKLVDIGLSLPTAADIQEAIGLKGFEMGPDAAVG